MDCNQAKAFLNHDAPYENVLDRAAEQELWDEYHRHRKECKECGAIRTFKTKRPLFGGPSQKEIEQVRALIPMLRARGFFEPLRRKCPGLEKLEPVELEDDVEEHLNNCIGCSSERKDLLQGKPVFRAIAAIPITFLDPDQKPK